MQLALAKCEMETGAADANAKWRAVTSLTPRHLRQAVRKLQITNCMNDFESKYQNHKGNRG
jgi:hypothetical protein